MKFVSDKSKPSLTPFSPNYNYFIGEENINDKINIDKILEIMFHREAELSTTKKIKKDDIKINRYKIFNADIFQKKHIKDLIDVIKRSVVEYSKHLNEQLPEKLWIQMWCNIMRENQSIEIHQHDATECSYLSGNLCLQSENTKTHYINPQTYFTHFKTYYSSNNKRGNLTIFPCTLPHYTDEVKDNNTRVTIAFDILTKENNKKLLWESKNNDLFRENIREF